MIDKIVIQNYNHSIEISVEAAMTSLVSIRINDSLLHAMKKSAQHLHLSQTEYIRRAIERMNMETEQQERSKRLKDASLRVRKESMHVNAEFSEIEHDPKS